ncbi:transposase [Halotia branconii]|uniref:Transposase n=1 Tax=Halotia branconii CENA392 TaxID=1539056 RepID=A0AAJ6NX08_9CYAN|nr:transposase [Halotia branconii]WGV24407.1 transposase [Halotia branconii CENA392]WGV25054.1 transposase [Halotia branconii CENA392]WGV25289.1 transposase [Halotia branconii CENA392]WGV26742.1 transposase [Halotia branconii CENA392]WGV28172.1 transposase [Halotia branconii CENA392]
MLDILSLLQCLLPQINATTMRRMNQIIMAMLAMSGRATMLGISRWTDIGGSYRTMLRFFHTVIPWATLFWLFFRKHLWRKDEVYLLAGDEVVVSKSGKQTYGLDRFFSSLVNKPISGLSFFVLSLVSVEQRQSFPIQIEQVIKSNTKTNIQLSSEKIKTKEKRGRGRPKGSKNKNKTEVIFTSELLLIKKMINSLFKLVANFIPLTYLVVDGHFGNNNALQMARQVNLHIISKLRHDSALYIPYENPDYHKRSRRKYGDKLDYSNIPDKYLSKSSIEDEIQSDIYQATLLHKEFAQALNVVILVKTNLKTNVRSHVVLFSSDLELSFEKIIDYYKLRFQIEFNFRDAKQFWGLEDFMNLRQTAVTNAANFAFFMVNLSHHLLADFRLINPGSGIIDLKAHYRGFRYIHEILKMLPEIPEPILLNQIFAKLTSLGRIHPVSTGVEPS